MRKITFMFSSHKRAFSAKFNPAPLLFNQENSNEHETGITFGNDLGVLLLKCPEFITLNPNVINDRKKSFTGWGFDGPDLGK